MELPTFLPGARKMNILVKYLPTRSPELNPIELVFQVLVQRMKRECLLGRIDAQHAAAATNGAPPTPFRFDHQQTGEW